MSERVPGNRQGRRASEHPVENEETSSAPNPTQALETDAEEDAGDYSEHGEMTPAGENTGEGYISEDQLFPGDALQLLQEYFQVSAIALRMITSAVVVSIISLSIAQELAVSEEQLAEAGFTPVTPTADDETTIYLRHHNHQDGDFRATASISGPYTREEAEEEVRGDLIRRFG